MTVTIVYVNVLPEFVDAFKDASLKNQKESVREPGNIRFDVLQMDDDPSRFVLYEAYNSEEEAAAHKGTEHYLEWRATVAHMMAEPRQGIKYTAIG